MMRMSKLRDRIAWRLANLILNTVASEDYKRSIYDLMERGMASYLASQSSAVTWTSFGGSAGGRKKR